MSTTAINTTNQETPLNLIDLRGNPRRYFDPAEMNEMIQSVRSNGVQTPILLRPSSIEGRYELIAGERRFRASIEVYGLDNGSIPSRIQAMSDEQADRAALIENTVRANMSASEESDAAHRVTESCKGDRDEAAKMLGWSRSTLDSRLALQNLTDAVKEALDMRKIKLGHAELLAATPMDKQDAALQYITENDLSIEDVRALMQRYALELESAIFDKTDCTSCPYNSALQTSLFESSVSDGHCTNKSCFESKTNDKLIAIQAEYKETFPTVKITDSPSSLGAIKVTVQYVGKEQIAGCKTCENYGAVVSSNPTELGTVYESQCFDSVCFGKKRMAFQEQTKAEKKATQGKAKNRSNPKDSEIASADCEADGCEIEDPMDNQEPEKIEKPSSKSKKNISKEKDAGAKKQDKSNGFSVENTQNMSISTRTQNYRREVWNNIFAQYFVRNPENAKRVFMALALEGKLSKPSLGVDGKAEKWVAGAEGCFIEISGAATTLNCSRYNDAPIITTENVSAEQLNRLAAFMVATKVKDTVNTKEEWLAQLAKGFDVRYADFAKVDRAFFEGLTKFEIQAVCYEAGFEPADESLSLDALMGRKKDEILDALLDGSFDWKGYTPAMLGLGAKSWTLVPKQVPA